MREALPRVHTGKGISDKSSKFDLLLVADIVHCLGNKLLAEIEESIAITRVGGAEIDQLC